MSSIMRARSALTGRWEAWEVIGGSSPKPKVAGPSMLGIGCPDRHALPITHTSAAKNALTVTRRPPARAGSFSGRFETLRGRRHGPTWRLPGADLQGALVGPAVLWQRELEFRRDEGPAKGAGLDSGPSGRRVRVSRRARQRAL